ncbi:phosphatase [Methylopila jiangsuensis]|uniref:Phosphatase n=1 Tax=Methylopila jiangsuensis TaxID=586230 RepID=A0A9W6N2D7_9HYPH|nr:metallophosphoesterase [Methylopila jiangsuensis]MDR6287341.1 3',5'-cyclic AMP phosphodiesterase CpdA [Methylopila jiangsuensis]GLK74922.1 phosphatase [Methylopila jiangsuensis]
MRLWILSDLHLSTLQARAGHLPFAIPDADVAVVAGDLCEGVEDAIGWLAATIAPRMPVVYALGNHEFYGEYIIQGHRVARAQAALVPGLHLLDDSAAAIGGVRFLGCTLWTDYMLQAHGERARQHDAMRTAAARFSDHRQIWVDPDGPGFVVRHFEPRDALALHEASVSWLDAQLRAPHAGSTVVVTHHAPHPMSVAERWREDTLTPAFVSDLSSLIDRGQPALWIHGHTHASFDYELHPLDGRPTRVICNARGYSGDENPSFDPALVVEV